MLVFLNILWFVGLLLVAEIGWLVFACVLPKIAWGVFPKKLYVEAYCHSGWDRAKAESMYYDGDWRNELVLKYLHKVRGLRWEEAFRLLRWS